MPASRIVEAIDIFKDGDLGIAEALLATALPARRRDPLHIRIEPDRQRSALTQCFIVSRPVRGLVLRRGRTAHASQLSRWIHAVNPSTDLCNEATPDGYPARQPYPYSFLIGCSQLGNSVKTVQCLRIVERVRIPDDPAMNYVAHGQFGNLATLGARNVIHR